MIINMGPQHPSTHGVLRLMLELDAETIIRAKPVVGYLHTGMEKTGEELTYVQGATNVTRMDYASPLSNELVFSMAVERLLDVEVPPRATWIRMYLNELNRIASHLLWQATNGLDMGALSMIIYGWREREETLRLLEKITGLRMNNNYIRPGGVAAELPDGWQDDTLELCNLVEKGTAEYDELLTGNPIWQERLVGVGVITTEQALALSATGPILRSTGFPWDLRKSQPYLAYDEVDFDVIYTQNGDCYDRYRLRLQEILESVKIVRQCVEKMPPGDYRVQDRKVTPPPRARIDESMEALIHHFKLFTEGFKVPPGETYVGGGVAPGRGRLLPGRRRHGEAVPAPYPGPVLLQPAGDVADDGRPADRRRGRRDLERRPDHGRGRPVMAFTPENRARADEIVARYPVAKSAILPLLHLAQDQDGWVSPDAMEEIGRILDLTPAQVLGVCSFYTMFKREHVGQLVVSVCTNVSCLVNGGPELLRALEDRHLDDDDVSVEEVECIAACDLAPVMQVNYDYHGPVDVEAAATIIDEYKSRVRTPRTISGTRVDAGAAR